MLLFLDFDGVLNGHEWCHVKTEPRINHEPVRCLNAIIVGLQCRIVVSSTWARHVENGDVTLRGFEWLLRTHGVNEPKVVGAINGHVTDPRDRANNIQIEACRLGSPDHWMAVDDLPLPLPTKRHVRPDPSCGLKFHNVTEAIEKAGMK